MLAGTIQRPGAKPACGRRKGGHDKKGQEVGGREVEKSRVLEEKSRVPEACTEVYYVAVCQNNTVFIHAGKKEHERMRVDTKGGQMGGKNTKKSSPGAHCEYLVTLLVVVVVQATVQNRSLGNESAKD